MNLPFRTFILLIIFMIAPVAAASTLTVAAASAGYIACALALFLFFQRSRSTQALAHRSAELEERLTNSEKSVMQLQKIRTELTNSLARMRDEMAHVEHRRQETADMLAQLRVQVERVARVDGLTGVANRQQFDISLHDEIKRCVREHKNVSLLLIEIDSFMDFRDINGEQKSEYILQKVAHSISDNFRRAGDLVARIGEYQFGVLLPGTDGDTAARFAEKLRRNVYSSAIPYPASEIADRVTLSIGIAVLPPVKLHKAEEAIRQAEHALRAAIEKGCNCIFLKEEAAA